MKLFQAFIASAALVAVGALNHADPAPTVHYATAENLEHIDVELIDSAKHEIDFAAHVPTDWPAMQALAHADTPAKMSRVLSAGRPPAVSFASIWSNASM
jgi:hypothetical protein